MMPALLGALLVFVLGALPGCGGSEKANNVPNPTTQPEVSSTTVPPNVAETAAATIDEASIRASLAHLTGASPAPLSSGEVTISDRGSEDGRRAAAQYMKESFEAVGILARVMEFTSGSRRGFNVEATLEGTGGEKHLWVSAHLDTVYNPGANDDGSGLVSILLTAEALKEIGPRHTVHFVAYDLEEFDDFEKVSLDGSLRYVRNAVSEIREQEGEQAIIGNLHSDMIGYDEDGFEAVMVTCNRFGPIDEAVLRAAEAIDSPIKLNVDENCLDYSDHKHFWDLGLPATLMIEGTKPEGYPWYHKPDDTIDKVNVPYLRSMIQLNAAATALLAAPQSES